MDAPSRRLALLLAYDGTAYAGWQRQPHAPTVQAAVEDAFGRLTGAPVRVVAAGRTDAGVHALGQVAHADARTAHPLDRMRAALNALLPPDVRVHAVVEPHPDFHARRDARLRVYRYLLLAREAPSVVLRRFTHHVGAPLDVEAMRAAAARLEGRHDFAAFRAAGTPTATTMCAVRRVAVEARGPLVVVTVAADRFLRQMVRRMVAVLVQAGRGRLGPDDVSAVLAARDPRVPGPPVPPQGLFLVRVYYPAGRLRPAAEGRCYNRRAGP